MRKHMRNILPEPQRSEMAQMYKDYYKFVFSCVRPSVRCDEDAEDATEEVFVRAIVDISNRPRTIQYPKPWLEKIAKSVCIRSTKNIGKKETSFSSLAISLPSLDEDCNFENTLIDEDDGPEQITEQQERVRVVLNAFEALDTHQRNVIYRYYIQGQTFEAISKDLGRAESTIRREAAKGRQNLRVHLMSMIVEE